jgi:ATP-binding cassette subfamily B protein
MLICAAGSLIFGILYAKAASKACAGLSASLRKDLYEKILSFSMGRIGDFSAAGLITRMTGDVMVIQNALVSGIRAIARGPVMLVLGLIMCFAINAKLAFVFLLVSPFLMLILYWIIVRIAPNYIKIQRSVDDLNQLVQENISAMRMIKSYMRSDHESSLFEKINTSLQKLIEKTNSYAFLNVPALQAAMYSATMLLLISGCRLITEGSMQVGELTGVLSYVLQILNSFIMISNVLLLIIRSMASMERINEVLEHEEEKRNYVSLPEKSSPLGRTLSFENVSFQYPNKEENPDSKRKILEDISFTMTPGMRFGIAGTTGSGKSTLLSLTDALYLPESGKITVDGVDLTSIDPADIRAETGIAFQNPALFAGTVRENLLWRNPQASEEELLAALKAACADEFVLSRPEGLDYFIEQEGANLSGGQRQRLAIARALVGNPSLLLLDDSVSALDSNTDEKVRENLKQLSASQIIVSSRIASLKDCDQILVLDRGKIAGLDSHEELMQSCAVYQEMAARQAGGKEQGNEEKE